MFLFCLSVHGGWGWEREYQAHWSLVSGLRSFLGEYPSLRSQVLSEGRGGGMGDPHQDQHMGTPSPLVRTNMGYPTPSPDTTCDGQDTQRTVLLLRSRRRIVLLLHVSTWNSFRILSYMSIVSAFTISESVRKLIC